MRAGNDEDFYMTCIIVIQMAERRRLRRYCGIRWVREISDRRRCTSRREELATCWKKASFREGCCPVIGVGYCAEVVWCWSHYTVHCKTFQHIWVVGGAGHSIDNNWNFPAARFGHHHLPRRPGGPPKTSPRLVLSCGRMLGRVDSVLLFLE